MSASNGCKLKCEFTESRKSATRLRRCAIARRHARSLCAATGSVAPPLLDGRESVASVTPRPYVCKHRCERDRKEGKPPAPVRHRSPTRSQPLRGHRHSRTSVYRWSRIGRVARAQQYACKSRGGRNPKVRQTACPVAPSLSATLADRVPARASTADPVYRWSKIGRVARPHQYACNDRGGRNLEVRQTPCPVAPSLSATLPDRAPARASTADPVYRWSKT